MDVCLTNIDCTPCVQVCWVHGTNLNDVDHLGNSALYYAVLHESVDMVRNLLVDPHVNVNQLCAEGLSPFMLSTIIRPRGHLPIFFSFLDLARNRLDLHLLEDRSKKNDVRVDPGGTSPVSTAHTSVAALVHFVVKCF